MRNSLASCDIEALEMETATERICASKDAFFRRLAVQDASVQNTILQVVQQELQQLIDDNSRLLVDYYPTIVRLAREAPFDAIRDAMALLQIEAKKTVASLDAGDGREEHDGCVSHFVDNACVTSIAGNEDEELCELFQDEYLRTGRVSHFVQLLAWHKSYLRLYQKSVVAIMVHDGALPLDWRSYIALMASSELRCHYLADLQQYYFVVNGGEYSWTMGIDFIPPKLFLLHEISSLLAHRPWLITPRQIAELLSPEQEDSWSVSELVHAIVVLCQYHSMACVALSMGCADEEDLSIWSHEGAEDAEAHAIRYLQRLDSADSVGSTECGTEIDIADMERDEGQLLELLKMSEHRVIRAMSVDEKANGDEEEEESPDSITVDEYEFEIAESEPGEDIHADDSSRRRDTLWRFCGGSVIRYADFDVHSQEYCILNTEDFSWAEHGFPLVRRYFPGKTGQILEDQFNLTSKLTYAFYGSQKEEEVDTSPYRHAIRYYVHRIFGICHDDYDYRQVNVYLNRPTKIFIKKVACTPWKVTKDDFEHFDHTLSASEKCHVTLLVAEARKQAGLMYGLRAVMQHMK